VPGEAVLWKKNLGAGGKKKQNHVRWYEFTKKPESHQQKCVVMRKTVLKKEFVKDEGNQK